MMASQKVHPTALPPFFKTSTYPMYAFALEKTRRLVGQNFLLSQPISFCEVIKR